MVTSIAQIIGKVNPKLYAENGSELLKKYGSADKIPAKEVEAKIPCEHKLVYETYSETLEPVYFFILDLMSDFGLSVEKLVDNFTATPGGQFFSEIGMKATRMQEEAMKILGSANTVLRSILNLVYDLKEFKIRLAQYDSLKSDKKEEKDAAKLALKQIWMDKVDISKGQSSIKAMAFGQAGYQTLIDAFLYVDDEKAVEKLDLNERVKRILKPRIYEFNSWLKESEKELRKRYEIQKSYLLSQVNSIKLYSRWAKPYLKVAEQLQNTERDREATLVNLFNRSFLELTLFGKSKIDPSKSALSGDLPLEFKKLDEKGILKRKYSSCVLVDFQFKAIPKQGSYIGKVEVSFKGYSLNDEELKMLDKELTKSEIGDMFSLIEGSTTGSLDKIQEEIDSFLKEEPEEKEEKKKEEVNPFLALIGHYEKKESQTEKKSSDKKDDKINPDSFYEEYLRKLAAEGAEGTTFSLFDIYKKAHGMASYT